MNVLWRSQEVIKATKGVCFHKWNASGVSIDSRKVKKGDIFCAMPGTKYDGHNFVDNAFNNGAVASIVSRDTLFKKSYPIVKVKDVPVALKNLAISARSRYKSKIIGITGSVGKTGTKEMLRLSLGAFGRVHANESSFNNHVGVPLSLARLPEESDFSIIELGMNSKNEIAENSKIVKPDLAIITNVEV